MKTKLSQLLEDLLSGDDELAEASVHKIAKRGIEVIDQLTHILKNGDVESRWWAVRALSAIASPAIPPILQNAFQDPDPSVRQCAALGLSRHPTPAALPELIAALKEKDRLLARLAATALVAIGAPAVPALIEVMESGPQIARLEAVKALAEIGDPQAIPVFFKAVKEGDSNLVEYWSEVGLDKLGIGMAFFKP